MEIFLTQHTVPSGSPLLPLRGLWKARRTEEQGRSPFLTVLPASTSHPFSSPLAFLAPPHHSKDVLIITSWEEGKRNQVLNSLLSWIHKDYALLNFLLMIQRFSLIIWNFTYSKWKKEKLHTIGNLSYSRKHFEELAQN